MRIHTGGDQADVTAWSPARSVVSPNALSDTGRGYVLRDLDGHVERLAELQPKGNRWGVVSVTSCTGFD